jgi:hypothetical protein
MASTFYRSGWRRWLNRLVRALLRVGLAPRHTYLLTVPGRRSGRLYATPVRLVEIEGQRWLVAPYGAVNWVRNAREGEWVMLCRRRQTDTVAIVEVGPEDSAPALQRNVAEVPIMRPSFAARPDALLDAFRAEAAQHPVFRIVGETD